MIVKWSLKPDQPNLYITHEKKRGYLTVVLIFDELQWRCPPSVDPDLSAAQVPQMKDCYERYPGLNNTTTSQSTLDC